MTNGEISATFYNQVEFDETYVGERERAIATLIREATRWAWYCSKDCRRRHEG